MKKPMSKIRLAIILISSSLLFPTIYLISFLHPFSFLSFEPYVRFNLEMQMKHNQSGGVAQNVSFEPYVRFNLEMQMKRNQSGGVAQNDILLLKSEKLDGKEQMEGHLHNSNETDAKSSTTTNTTSFCDTSHERYDTCFLLGDIRIQSNASALLLTLSSASPTATPNTTWTIKPFPRKWEAPVMAKTKQLSIISSQLTPAVTCTVNYTMPAVIFSTGGFSGNFYHDVTDILVPLFVTSRRFNGQVKFLVTDFNGKFVAKYRQVLRRLSGSDVVNLDGDNGVHCFREVHVGLINNKEFGIDTTKPPSGLSMNDFREFLRSSFSLKRNTVKRNNSRKPRLMIQLRKGSRELVNSREVISMSKKLGFKVIVSGVEDTKNLTSFSAAVNSVDALLGVHGAGLSNMVFLPDGAALVQIVPWGGLKWACRFSFGDPAVGMGLKYFEYEIKEEESSLIEQYPRNHSVFTNPAEIHRQGWNMLWYVFLEKQKVKVDVRRLRAVLVEVMQFVRGGEEKNMHFLVQ